MRIHDIRDADGRVQAFEVSAWPTARNKERLCEFKVGGVPFLVHEPFGESEHSWVGPAAAGWCPQLAVTRETFTRARPFVSEVLVAERLLPWAVVGAHLP